MDALIYDLTLAALRLAVFLALKSSDARLAYVFGFLS
jgi:hypothetical protein